MTKQILRYGKDEWRPDEEFARNYIALAMGVHPDKVVNVEIAKDGFAWNFMGNLKIDKPRFHGKFVMKD